MVGIIRIMAWTLVVEKGKWRIIECMRKVVWGRHPMPTIPRNRRILWINEPISEICSYGNQQTGHWPGNRQHSKCLE